MYFKEEKFPDHIKFVQDTLNNRKSLRLILGEPKTLSDSFSYIEINLLDHSWRSTSVSEWLYRNIPPVISIDEALKICV